MFLTLNEYLTGASKMLSLYGYKCHRNDEDAIAYVAHCMMNADATWDGTQSSRNTWRFIQAKYAIMKLRTKERKKRKLVSLNTEIRSRGDNTVQLHEVLPGKTAQMPDEQFGSMIQKARTVLSSKQYTCLTMHYLDNLTLETIGEHFDISRERVRQIIKKAIQILQNEYQIKPDHITS